MGLFVLRVQLFKPELVANYPVGLVLPSHDTPLKVMSSSLYKKKTNSKLDTFFGQLLLRIS